METAPSPCILLSTSCRKEPAIDLQKILAVACYGAILIGIGVVASRRMRSMRDYFAGGKNMGFLSVAFSARATGESAWLLLGLTGFGAAFGFKGFWIVLGELLGVGTAWLVLSRRFKRLTDRYDSVTVPDYLESRFKDTGHVLRGIAAIALCVFVSIYVSAQIHATGTAFHSFLNVNYFVGALIGFAIVLVYITAGGFVAVVWSDVFQGSLMVIGLVALPIVGILSSGGFGEIGSGLREHYPGLLTWTGGDDWSLLTVFSIIGLVMIGLGFLGSPQIFVRFIALRSEDEIRKGAAVALVWTLLADSGAVCIGIIGRVLLTGDLGSGGQDVLPQMVEAYLPPFLAGIYIAVVLSAIMSTIDSLLVVASSAAARDYYQKILRPQTSDTDLVKLARLLTVVLALAALTIAMLVGVLNDKQEIFWFVVFGWTGIAATFCPTIILSLFWKGMTANGAKAGMIAGFLSVPILKFGVGNIPTVGKYFNNLDQMVPAFLISWFFAVVVSQIDRRGKRIVPEVADDLEFARRR